MTRAVRCAAVLAVVVGCLVPAATASAVAETHLRGLVTAADGGAPVANARIEVFSPSGRIIDDVSGDSVTAADGTYDFVLSRRSADNRYYVCIATYSVPIPPGGTGYVPACLGDVPYTGGPVGEVVTVKPGTTRRHLDVHLATGAALTIHVRTSDGTPIASAQVYVFPDGSSSGGAVQTDGFGRATQAGLTPGAYRVCSPGPPFGAPRVGYRAACWRDAFWPGFGPTGQSVGIVAGVRKVITIVLRRQGAIAGRVTAQDSGQLVPSEQLAVFDSGATASGPVFTDRSGRYFAAGLPTGDYVVCARGNHNRRLFPTGLLARCTGQVAWDGSDAPPADAVPVHVEAGHVTRGIDLALPAGP